MRRALTWLRNPVATVLLAMGLVWSLYRISSREAPCSTVGGIVFNFTQRHIMSRLNGGRVQLVAPDSSWLRTYATSSYVLHEGEWVRIQPDARAPGSPAMPDSFKSLPRVAVRMSGGSHRGGWYAPTRYQETLQLTLNRELDNPAPSSADLARLRVMHAAVLGDHDAVGARGEEGIIINDEIRARLGAYDIEVHRRLWGGYAHDTGALIALCAFIYSARYTCSPWWWRKHAREGRLARGKCPRCRYDIRGLARTRCPECGAEWGAEQDREAKKERV